ncbi:hypothetical protein A71_44 [Escherichia phage A7_1]|uniref:Glutaredoxin domain-containing protein n=1 Tax=Escherichia phage A73 TaxID=3003819 RepID=A0AAF0AQM8_9CAUD|nr:hypothetical protein A71_44 [Escherichia phage A7_1]WBF77743.1 hypothetical protein A73_211 [Escherichia phage A73]WBF77995.1 hypothetical protein W70_196 [Escherichia phage W70]
MSNVIFGKVNCPFCDNAKTLLDQKGYEYEYIDVGANSGNLQEMVKKVSDAVGYVPRTVPQIFIDSEYVGGYTELVAKNLPSKVELDFNNDDLGDL